MNSTNFTPFTPFTPEQQAQIQQAQNSALQAATQQPTANLQQTQAQTGEAGAAAAAAVQSAATSAQEQQNLEVQNPGFKAQAQIDLVNEQQKQARQNLGIDLTQNHMTLPSAIRKYAALGMHPNDVFNQYLAQSSYGAPTESPEKLQELGVTKDALGDIGTPGSFQDKYNTKNAIQELRNLQDLWNQTSTTSKLPFLGKSDANAKAYQSALVATGQHLSSLIPGASSSEGSNNALLGALPQLGDPTEMESGAAQGQFKAIERQLLSSKGYTLSDLGLAPATQPKPQSQGGGLLSGLLGGIINPISDVANSLPDPFGGVDTSKINLPKNGSDVLNRVLQAGSKTGEAEARTLTNPTVLSDATTLATLPDILAGGAGGLKTLGKIVTGGAKAATEATSSLPSALKTFINPKGAISQAGNVRGALLDAASKSGVTVDGDSMLSDITNWSQKAKMGNLGQGKAIDTAISDAENVFKGKQIDPKDVMDAYREADSGYTASGIAKTPIQANIDRGLRDIFSKYLDKAAPGWQNSTTSMAKAYKAQKSPVRAGLKNLAKFGLPLAGGGAAGDAITHFLFPPNH